MQVIARATRLFPQKQFANIVSFVPIKKTFDEALSLYNNDKNIPSEHISWATYDEAVEEFIESVKNLRKIANTVKDAKKIKDAEKRKELIEAFFTLYKNFRVIQSYIEYEFDEIKFGIKETEIDGYKGIIATWRDEEDDDGEKFEDSLNYNFELLDDDSLREIDTNYIRRLISRIIKITDEKIKKKEAYDLICQINSSKNELIIIQKEILLKSIDEALNASSIEEYYNKIGKVVEEMKDKDIEKFVTDNDIDSIAFKKFMDNYILDGTKKELIIFVDDFVSIKNTDEPIYVRKTKLRESIQCFISNFKVKYDKCY